MLVECAYRFRFYPTDAQAFLLARTFGCVRVVYNKARALREAAWNNGKKQRVGYRETSALLPIWKKEEATAWLSEVSAVPLQQALRHLDTAYRNFFQKRARYPKFKRKDDTQAATFTKAAFDYTDGKLTLAKMAEPLPVVWSRDLPCEPSSVVVTREADGRWYVACRVETTTQEMAGGGEIGIDVGLTHLATLSTGEKIENPRHLNKRLKQLARAQRRLAKKQKGSNNRAKAKRKVARVHAAVRHQRQDFLQQLSTRLIRENQAIYVETLSIKGMLRSKRMSRSIADAGWGELIRQLTYKAAWYGRRLVKINRFEPSTKTCHLCGTTGHVLSLADRTWSCPDCGTEHDRDINAAKNILAAGQAASACGANVRPVRASARGQFATKQEAPTDVGILSL